jgi:hypothetical protein
MNRFTLFSDSSLISGTGFISQWLPIVEANLVLFWQWLFANPIITLGVSVVLLLWACLVIRKSTHDDWTFARFFLIILLFASGFVAMLIAFQVA